MSELLYIKTNLLSSATVTTTSADSLFPKTNLYDGYPSRSFRFAAIAVDDNITIDLGAAATVDFGSLHGHNIDSGITAIELRSSSDNFASVDTLRATMTKRNPAFYSQLAASVSRRYWRFKFVGTNGVPIEIGEAVLGLAGTLTRNPMMPQEVFERRRQIRNITRAGEISVVNLTNFPDREVSHTFRGNKTQMDDIRQNLWEGTEHGANPVTIVPNSSESEVMFGLLRQSMTQTRIGRESNSGEWLYEYELVHKELPFPITIVSKTKVGLAILGGVGGIAATGTVVPA
jgi:hypothetical protein